MNRLDPARQALEMTLLEHTPLRDRETRKAVVHARRRIFESWGSKRYSRPGHAGIDQLLERYLPVSGVFFEAGANDGYTWSNTYYLERWRGWRGVLVEGIPALAENCTKLRTQSKVFNCALVPPDHFGEQVVMRYSDLGSLVRGSEPTLERLLEDRREDSYEVVVPARTLTSVLAEADLGAPDFMSLDLEGFEAPALRGLDFDRFAPRWLLVEILGGEGVDGVTSVLRDRYELVTEVGGGDMLYRLLS